jgi:GTP cyclohydrolase I
MIDQVLSILPLQEEIPGMVGERIEEATEPMGVGVLVHGEHMCTRMRGVKSPCMEAVTDFLSGLILHDTRAREEFLVL